MKLSLRKLQQIVALAEEGGFSRAADRLAMSQPALSRSIAQLEADLSLTLFDRKHSGVTPTTAGTELVRDARRILGQMATIEDGLVQRSQGEAGHVRVGFGPLSAELLAAPLLAHSVQRWPQLVVSATIHATDELVEALVAGQLDFSIVSQATLAPHPLLQTEPMATLPMGYYVRADHPLSGATEWSAIARYPRATGRFDTRGDGGAATLFGGHDGTVFCDDFAILRQVTTQSDAVWLASPRVVAQDVASGTLRELILTETAETIHAEIVLARLRGRSLSPAAANLAVAARKMLTS